MTAWHSCLYQGRVRHHRLRPVRHHFAYRVLSLYLDLDELAALDAGLRLFSVERPNLLSFRAADHGARDGSPLKPWVLARLAAIGLRFDRPRIMLLCFPRVLGQVFNPLSIYFCHEGERLVALVYEVRNTFGEQHVYAFAVPDAPPHGRLAPHACAKAFYVSPFIGMTARYHFHLAAPGERLAVVIKTIEDGAPTLVTSQIGARRDLTDRVILRCLLADPLPTLKVLLGIYVEALRLWLKGAPLRSRRRMRTERASP